MKAPIRQFPPDQPETHFDPGFGLDQAIKFRAALTQNGKAWACAVHDAGRKVRIDPASSHDLRQEGTEFSLRVVFQPHGLASDHPWPVMNRCASVPMTCLSKGPRHGPGRIRMRYGNEGDDINL